MFGMLEAFNNAFSFVSFFKLSCLIWRSRKLVTYKPWKLYLIILRRVFESRQDRDNTFILFKAFHIREACIIKCDVAYAGIFIFFKGLLAHQPILTDEYNDCLKRLIELTQWKIDEWRNSSNWCDDFRAVGSKYGPYSGIRLGWYLGVYSEGITDILRDSSGRVEQNRL